MLISLHSSTNSSLKKPLFEGRFRRKKHDLFSGHALLYEDRLILEDPVWQKKSPDVIPLTTISWIHWMPYTRRDTNTRIHLSKGRVTRLYFDSPGLWKYEIQEQCSRLGNQAPLERKWKGLWKKVPVARSRVNLNNREKESSKITSMPGRGITSSVPHTLQPSSVRKILKLMVNRNVTQWLSSMGYLVRDATPKEILSMLAAEASNWGLSVEQLVSVILQEDSIQSKTGEHHVFRAKMNHWNPMSN